MCTSNHITARRTWRLQFLCALLLLAHALHPTAAAAHILQYLTWFNVERSMEISGLHMKLSYDCRFNPRVFNPADPLMDTDGDSTASQHETADFCSQAGQYLAQDLMVMTSGTRCELRQESFSVADDLSGFRSTFSGGLPALTGSATTYIIDPSYLPLGPIQTQPPAGHARSDGQRVLFRDSDGRTTESLKLPPELRTALPLEFRAGP